MEYASNTPVSGPVNLPNINPDLNFNGIMWSNKWGFMFQAVDQTVPFRLPTQVQLF